MQYGSSNRVLLAASSAAVSWLLANTLTADFAHAHANAHADNWQDQLAAFSNSAKAWLEKEYNEAPALVIAAGVAVCAPVLAIFGLVLRQMFRPGFRPLETVPLTEPPRAWQVQALLQVVDADADHKQFEVGHGLVRIGREEDNDVQLVHKTVHRYHAVIERTPESEFVITDVSGEDGNGVRVDGERVQRHRLRGGELIDIGRSRLKFALSEA